MKQFTLVLSLLSILLIGCTVSDEGLITETIEETNRAFQEEPFEANEKTELFSYYLPNGFTIKDTKTYNVLLESDNKDYILFFNNIENENSKVSYETLVEQYKNPFISETFEGDNGFGYLFVNKIGDNKFEVTVGIGGSKLTTVSNAGDMIADSKSMMEIINSIK